MGWKGTGRYLCSSCKAKGVIKPLTKDNCSPSVFKKRVGDCRDCMTIQSALWRKRNPDSYSAVINRYRESNPGAGLAAVKKYNRTVRGRHAVLKYKFEEEGIPKEDPIFSFHFYAESIKDNECHYCLGPLNPTSHGLDRRDNNIGHTGFNVVPCCKSCNQKKMGDTTYEEMMLLAPVLREIRKRREAKC